MAAPDSDSLQQGQVRENWESHDEDQTIENYKDNEKNCKIHNEPLEYFCSACEVLICVMCTCVKKHHIVDKSAAAKTLQQEVDRYQRDLSQLQRRLEGGISLVKGVLHEIRNTCKTTSLSKKYSKIFTNSEESVVNILKLLNEMKTSLRQYQSTNIPIGKNLKEIKKAKTWQDEVKKLICKTENAFKKNFRIAKYSIKRIKRKTYLDPRSMPLATDPFVGQIKVYKVSVNILIEKKQRQLIHHRNVDIELDEKYVESYIKEVEVYEDIYKAKVKESSKHRKKEKMKIQAKEETENPWKGRKSTNTKKKKHRDSDN